MRSGCFRPKGPKTQLREVEHELLVHFSYGPRLRRRPSYSAHAGYPVRRSFSIHHQRSGILDHPLSRMMTARCAACSRSLNAPPLSRGAMRPRFATHVPQKIRGRSATPRGEQGKPGARCTRSRACVVVSTRVSHHRSTGTPGLPCAMVLRLISRSPW